MSGPQPVDRGDTQSGPRPRAGGTRNRTDGRAPARRAPRRGGRNPPPRPPGRGPVPGGEARRSRRAPERAWEEGMAEETTAPDAEKPAKSGKGKLMLIVGLLVLVAGGAGAAWYLQLLPGTKKAEAKQGAAEAPKPAVGALLALDPFIANLGDE